MMTATQSLEQNAQIAADVAHILHSRGYDAALADDMAFAAVARVRDMTVQREAECERRERWWADTLSNLEAPHG